MKQTFKAIQNLKITNTDRLWNAISNNQLNTQCGNGDFEIGIIDNTEWSAGYGIAIGINDPTLVTFTGGFLPTSLGISPVNAGALCSNTSASLSNQASETHQALAYQGNDPIVGANLKTTAPSLLGNNYSLRIGNSCVGNGTEFVSKKMVVGNGGIINFMYAVVMNGIHGTTDNPSFFVKVYNSNWVIIPNSVFLNPISPSVPKDLIIADVNDPFFQRYHAIIGAQNTPDDTLFKDWTCAKIDLSKYIGQTVSIVFGTTDCTHGGHFAYGYIDGLCGNCDGASTGSINIKPITNPCIGQNPQVCVNYTLPKIGTTTGNGTIKLEFYQNGILVPSATLISPTITSGTNYCFNISPSKLSCNNKGYDIVATGNFMIGTTPITVTSPDPIGSLVVGIIAGQNNDLYCCQTLAESCCTNFVKTITATTTMVGNATTGYNTIKIVPKFIAGPRLIKKVVISIMNVETNSSNKECLTCESQTSRYGSMSVPNGYGLNTADKIEGMSYPTNSFLTTCYGCPPIWTGLLSHEVTWGSNSGPGYNLMDGIGDQSTSFYVFFPKKSTISCCDDTIKVCVKYSFTDIDCKTCDAIVCYKVINRQNVISSVSIRSNAPSNKDNLPIAVPENKGAILKPKKE